MIGSRCGPAITRGRTIGAATSMPGIMRRALACRLSRSRFVRVPAVRRRPALAGLVSAILGRCAIPRGVRRGGSSA